MSELFHSLVTALFFSALLACGSVSNDTTDGGGYEGPPPSILLLARAHQAPPLCVCGAMFGFLRERSFVWRACV